MALAGKIQDDQVMVVDGLSLDAADRPKSWPTCSKTMGLEGKSALIATAEHAPTVIYKSARNIPAGQK